MCLHLCLCFSLQQDGISGAINHFQNTVLSVPNLVPDSYFDAFTSPYINNKLEEKTCGFGPSLSAVFDDDKNFHTIIFQIKVYFLLLKLFL